MPLEYKTVGAQRLDLLEELVNIAIADGWVPQGGLVVGNDTITHYFIDRADIDRGDVREQQVTRRTWYQALVREEEPENTTGAET